MSDAPLPVIVNRSGGTASRHGDALEAQLRDSFAAAGQAIALALVDGDRVADEVRAAADAVTIAVGGGDGTLNAAAALLAGSGAALAVLPLGTRNHFARQIGVPLDLAEAARCAAQGTRAQIDIARAGERRVFINNASIGLYTRLVRHRESHPGPKWWATIPAAWHVLRHPRPEALGLTLDGARREVFTALLFVGNNRYALDATRLGERESLSDGVLSLYVVPPLGVLALLGFAVRVLFGRDPSHCFELLAEAREVVIEGGVEIEIALDGEVDRLPLPLTLASAPGALTVIVPAVAPAPGAAGAIA